MLCIGIFAATLGLVVAVSHPEKVEDYPVHISINARGGMTGVKGRGQHVSNKTLIDQAKLIRTSRQDAMHTHSGGALDEWQRTKRTRWFREARGRTYMTAKKLRRRRSVAGSHPAALSTIEECSRWPKWEPPPSVFKVQNISHLGLPLNRAKRLLHAGASKGILSLGNFLIVASQSYPDHLLVYAANVAAEILDPDKDGCPSSIAACFDGKRDTVNMAYATNKPMPLFPMVAYGGCTKDEADRFTESYGDDKEDGGGGPVSDLQTWNLYDDHGSSIIENALGRDDPDTPTVERNVLHGIINEEIYHSLTQGGYCRKYPKELGVEGWTSILAKAVLEAEGCRDKGNEGVWYSHPENNCSKMPHKGSFEKCAADRAQEKGCFVNDNAGDGCLDANCDIVEFLHKVMYLHMGVQQECSLVQPGQGQCCEMYDVMNDNGIKNAANVDLALHKGFYGSLLLNTLMNPSFEMPQSLPTGVYTTKPWPWKTCAEPKANFTCLPIDDEEEEGPTVRAATCRFNVLSWTATSIAMLAGLSSI